MRREHAERLSPGREAGFTLVETAIATFVMLIGALATVGIFDDSRDLGATGERHEIAVLQAEQALEEMRGLPYEKLMLSAGAGDPEGDRVTGGGAQFTVRLSHSERLVYYSTEGASAADAWVDPVSTVSIGVEDNPLDLTVYRWVSWRDEECRVVDLDSLGLGIPAVIDGTQVPLANLVNNLINSVLGLVGNNTALTALKTRLQGLSSALTAHEARIATAASGLSEIDLCDADLTALERLQDLGQLNPGLGALNGLTDDLEALERSLANVCILNICLIRTAQTTAINTVNTQLNCLFGTGSGGPEFAAYLDGVADGLEGLTEDVAHTDRNTKRLTVAVVVEPRSGVGPSEPVWATSVVRDPTAGLLSSSGSACQ